MVRFSGMISLLSGRFPNVLARETRAVSALILPLSVEIRMILADEDDEISDKKAVSAFRNIPAPQPGMDDERQAATRRRNTHSTPRPPAAQPSSGRPSRFRPVGRIY